MQNICLIKQNNYKLVKLPIVAKSYLFRELVIKYISISGLIQFSYGLSVRIPGSTNGKESTCLCKRLGFNPWSGRSPGGGHGNPLQYSCLKNSMDRGAWQATVQGVAKSWTLLKRLRMYTCIMYNWNTLVFNATRVNNIVK